MSTPRPHCPGTIRSLGWYHRSRPESDLETPRIIRSEIPKFKHCKVNQCLVGLTAIGDSVTAAAGRELRERLPGADVDAEIGRQMWDLPGLVARLRDVGRLGQVVVIGLGTNGAFDESALDAALRTIGPSRRVIMIEVSVPRSWQDTVNAALDTAQRR